MNKNQVNKPEDWEAYFREIGLREDLIVEYMPFVRSCLAAKIPPIFEHEHLSQLLGLEPSTLLNMVFGTGSFYRSFTIPKRSGGRRAIVAPYPSLLQAQRWIVENILNSVKVGVCVTGFRTGKSIVDNATLHCNRAELLKVDIKDFFPTIGFSRVMSVFLKLGYPSNVAFMLSRLCTLDELLPQGAATSPMLSNIVCRRMDARIYMLCKRRRLRYTRYADDITVSGKEIAPGISKLLFEIVQEEGFEVNDAKVRFVKDGEKKIVTGLDITSGRPRVPRSFRRDLQRDVYFVWSSGLSSHVSRRKIFNPQYIEHLQGRVNFWRQVEPECNQLETVEARMRDIQVRHQRITK